MCMSFDHVLLYFNASSNVICITSDLVLALLWFQFWCHLYTWVFIMSSHYFNYSFDLAYAYLALAWSFYSYSYDVSSDSSLYLFCWSHCWFIYTLSILDLISSYMPVLLISFIYIHMFCSKFHAQCWWTYFWFIYIYVLLISSPTHSYTFVLITSFSFDLIQAYVLCSYCAHPYSVTDLMFTLDLMIICCY